MRNFIFKKKWPKYFFSLTYDLPDNFIVFQFHSFPDEFKDVQIKESQLPIYLNKLKKEKYAKASSSSEEIISAFSSKAICGRFHKPLLL